MAKCRSIELRNKRLAGEDEVKGRKYTNDVIIFHESWFIPGEQTEYGEHERRDGGYYWKEIW